MTPSNKRENKFTCDLVYYIHTHTYIYMRFLSKRCRGAWASLQHPSERDGTTYVAAHNNII